ncbi:hypothetical protein C5S35_00060 [Candidatus Methanophagaceae archaeon]|nr:hypothetical protein C5S35_00060 [Methanophagales archaeon]
MFREEDFVILHPDPIFAIIEVKTKIQNSKPDLVEIFKKASENGIKVLRNKKRPNHPIHFFNGVFSYDTEMNFDAVLDAFKNHWDAILNNPKIDTSRGMVEGTVTHMCLNQSIYLKEVLHGFSAFTTKQQAPAYFISELFEYLNFDKLYGCDNWFAFPMGDGEIKGSIKLVQRSE